MFKYGLKLWSNNINYLNEAVRLYEQGVYQYIELYVLPDMSNTQSEQWKSLDIPYVVHAPHYMNGLNLANREQKESNFLLIRKSQKVADLLQADKIIVHPGISGDITETARQLKEISEQRILVENKPYYALVDDLVCNGATFEDIKFVLDNTGVGFCLDIGHAICAANALEVEPFTLVKKFIGLQPAMYHFTDGGYDDIYDKHYHFGKGDYRVKAIMCIITPKDSFITVETVKNFKNSLIDFEDDIKYLEALT